MVGHGDEQAPLCDASSVRTGLDSGRRTPAIVAVAAALLAATLLAARASFGPAPLRPGDAMARNVVASKATLVVGEQAVPSVSSDTVSSKTSVGPFGIRWGPDVFGGGAIYEPTRGSRHTSTTLFCFSVAMTSSEVGLMRSQFHHRAGIFQCDGARVYGGEPLSLQPGNERAPRIIPHAMPPSTHSQFGFYCNWEIFAKVLDLIFLDGAFKQFDVVVKVDPDTVFFPARLQARLAVRRPAEEPWYLANSNCSHLPVPGGKGYITMQGPLEVFSRGMLQRFGQADRASDCVLTPNETLMAGEDMYLDRCMHWLGGHRLLDLDLVRACPQTEQDPAPNGVPDPSCTQDAMPAYHPYKDVDGWNTCHRGSSRRDQRDRFLAS
uniref:Hexosyltransferase n=1 Tax=Zooxanthella nutricula TaxID=1333877 RepID=A0A6U6ULD5_9DINO